MEALTVTKDTTGVLSGEKMAECAFGLLCAAFAEQIMARTGFHEGMYRQVALELLQEGEADAAQPAQNVFNIDLSLILQAIRSEAEKNRARPATQKLIERVIHIKETQSVPARQTQAPRETSLTGRNAFSQTPPAGWTASSRLLSLQMNALPGGQPPLSGETAGNRTPQASWPSFIRNFRRNDALKSRPTALPYDPRKPRAQALAPRRAGEAAKTFGLTHAKEASLQPDGGNARRTPLLTGEQAFLKAESTPQPSVPAVSKSLQPEELALRETQDTEEQKTQQAERRNVPAADKKPEKTADATAESRSNRRPDGQTAKAAGAAPAAPTAEAKSATLQARDIRVAPVSGETAGDAASGKVPQTPAPEEGIPYTLAEQIISAGIEDLTYAQTEKATAAT
ncbi:MAG: hypothetical protein ACOYI3_04360, partial [Christensenellales bacterium]